MLCRSGSQTDNLYRARETVANIVTLLFDTIARYIETAVIILLSFVPGPGERTLYIKAIHSGATKGTDAAPGKTWLQYDSTGFKEAGKLFSKFIAQTDSTSPIISRTCSSTKALLALSSVTGEGNIDDMPDLIALGEEEEDESKGEEDGNESESNEDENENEDGSNSEGESDKTSDKDEDVPLTQASRKHKAKKRRSITTKKAVWPSRLNDEEFERRWTAMAISPALHESVQGLQGKEWRIRLVDIMEADGFELAREEQIAVNNVMLRHIMNREQDVGPSFVQPLQLLPSAPTMLACSSALAASTMSTVPGAPTLLMTSTVPAVDSMSTAPALSMAPTTQTMATASTASAPSTTSITPAPSAMSIAPAVAITSTVPALLTTSTTQAMPAALTAPAASTASSELTALPAPICFFSTVNPDDWPAWLNKAYTHLFEARLGSEFEAVLVA